MSAPGSERLLPRVLVALLVVLGALGGVAWRLRSRPVPAGPVVVPSADAEEPDVPLADWCAPGFSPIEGGGCFAGDGGATGTPLVVYLHGRYASDAGAPEVDRQRRLATRARLHGFSVLALRGRLGTCTAQELAGWFCWPSNERNAEQAPGFVEGWRRALSAAQQRAGSRTRFVLGFSNGGYFAGLIASRALLDAAGFVVAHGGPVEPVRAAGQAPPLLLLSADDDVAQDDMIRFHEELAREGWPHDAYARAGVHELADEDIEAALTFFTRVKEKLPLDPPLPLHRAVRHAREAGAPDEELAPSSTSATASTASPYDDMTAPATRALAAAPPEASTPWVPPAEGEDP